MSDEQRPQLTLEIGHVLFIDIVGYTKLLIHEQLEYLEKLREIVRATETFRAAQATGTLMRLPTGDGGALVFRTDPEAAAKCAVEIARELKNHPELRVRMGIHSGPVKEVTDLSEQGNIAGAGINIAQRVMDCGDAGHILLSKRVADDLEQFAQWRPLLHDLGMHEVKHGVRLGVANLYDEEIGNSVLPQSFRQSDAAAFAGKRLLSRNATIVAGIAVLLVLAGAFALWRKSNAHEPTGSARERHIAVLPFHPLGAENNDQVLELGMADTLIAKLSNSRDLIVNSLTSVRKYGGAEADPIAAGRALNVNAVLEGSVQRAGDRIHVTARLINVADGRSLWSDTFDDKFTDVFTVQNTIAQKVAGALALRLSGEETARLTKRDTANIDAYQLYLTGRFHLNKLVPPEIRQSIQEFEQAITLDPNYALAYYGLSEAYRSLAITADVPPKETCPEAIKTAQKAIAIDDSLAEAHASLAFTYVWFDWNWAAAEQEAKRAIELNPNLAFAHIAYANLLADLARHDQAAAEATRARELDPGSIYLYTLSGAFRYWARRYDESATLLNKALELDPHFWIARLFLAKVSLDRGISADAIAGFEQAREFSGGNSEAIAMLGVALAAAGKMDGAREILQQLQSLSSTRYVPPYNLATLEIALGRTDDCFGALEQAYTDHDVRLSFLRVDPRWDPVRSEPRFVSLLQRVGLSQ
jgi:serine/threonine-protein kinase